MVAAEPFPEAIEPGDDTWPFLGDVDTLSLSVREVRRLLSSQEYPQPDLIARLVRDPRVTVRRIAYGSMRRGRNLASNEDMFRINGIRYVAGADEAGRGALAGPIAAAAVMFEPGVVIKGVDDSKALTPEEREGFYEEIVSLAASISVVFVDSGLIDRWGLQQANIKALWDAVEGIDSRCQCVICDHFALPGCRFRTFGLPVADATFQSVAAASIVAKVERDNVMRSLHRRFPDYNFKDNKGYATVEHLMALGNYGHSPVHRLSFSGVLPADEPRALWEE